MPTASDSGGAQTSAPNAEAKSVAAADREAAPVRDEEEETDCREWCMAPDDDDDDDDVRAGRERSAWRRQPESLSGAWSPFALDAADSDCACKKDVVSDDDSEALVVVRPALSSTASASAHDDHDSIRALALAAFTAIVAFHACAADANHAEQ